MGIRHNGYDFKLAGIAKGGLDRNGSASRGKGKRDDGDLGIESFDFASVGHG